MSSHEERCSVKSMTGFARVSGTLGDLDVEVEIRSVNHRFFEVSFRGPRALGPLERDLRGVLQREHRRGRFDVSVARRGRGAVNGQAPVHSTFLDEAVAAYASACKRYGVGAEGLAKFIGELVLRDMTGSTDAVDVSDSELSGILELVRCCSASLRESREAEGAQLVVDVEARVAAIDVLRRSILQRVSGNSARARDRMLERLVGLAPEVRVDPERLAMEVALVADRLDVSEELSRLEIHVTQFSQLMRQGHPEGIGRKLDFMIQEIARELNTIGSKAQDAEVQGNVVEAKAELERIREQVQNIE
jgi:uncharacterized protein (TIGR00255 family)